MADGSRFRGVIFDFDGTIADTLPVCISAFQATFALHGGPTLDSVGVRALFGPSEEGVLVNTLGEAGHDALETYLDEYRKLHDQVSGVFPGMGELLADIRRRSVPMAIVSGKGERSLEISLDLLGISDYFSPVCAGSARGPVKAEAMTLVSEGWDIEPAAIASVGDHVADIREGYKAGTYPIGAAWAHPETQDLLAPEHPHHTFDSVPALAAWLLPQL